MTGKRLLSWTRSVARLESPFWTLQSGLDTDH